MTCVRTVVVGAVRATVGDALQPLAPGEHGAPRAKLGRVLVFSGGLVLGSPGEVRALSVALDDLAKDMRE